MSENGKALRRRIAPGVPLLLSLEDANGSKFKRSFTLAFDFNAVAAVEEVTGYSLLKGEAWAHNTAAVISTMFWAAVLAHHPEYDTWDDRNLRRTPEGLEVLRSYMDDKNVDEISEALWKAYLDYLSPAKRDILVAARARAEKAIPTLPSPETTQAAVTESGGLSSGPSADTTSASAMTKSAS
jgi:hypothetical protein